MKLKSTADGLKAVKELELQLSLANIRINDLQTRLNSADELIEKLSFPKASLEVKEQVREEATDMSGVPNTPMPEYYKELGKRMEASNPEFAKPNVQVFTYDLSAYQFFRANAGDKFDGDVYYKGTIDDVVTLMENYQKQATQQQGLVSLESVIEILQKWCLSQGAAFIAPDLLEELKTLKQ